MGIVVKVELSCSQCSKALSMKGKTETTRRGRQTTFINDLYLVEVYENSMTITKGYTYWGSQDDDEILCCSSGCAIDYAIDHIKELKLDDPE